MRVTSMSDPCATSPARVRLLYGNLKERGAYTVQQKKKKRITALSCQCRPFEQPGLGKEKNDTHKVPNAGRNTRLLASLRNFRLAIVVRCVENDCEGDQNVTVSVSHQVHDKPSAPQEYYASFTSFTASGLSPRYFESHSRRLSGPM